jgi:nicotinamide-nucleotide amidase
MAVLGVRAETLATHGAVSAETAAEMAGGALLAADVDVAVAVTGIAGPGGATPGTPVGTVWFGWCFAGTAPTVAHRCFAGDRQSVREQTVAVALDGLIELLRQQQD